MTVQMIQTGGSQPSGQAGATATKDMGRDQFMLLLLTQLRHQDPLKPMEDREFIAQLAQFNVLEQMQQMNEGLLAMMYMDQFTQASALIGKTVEAVDPATGEIVAGQVTEVSLASGVAELMVGERAIGLENVIKIR